MESQGTARGLWTYIMALCKNKNCALHKNRLFCCECDFIRRQQAKQRTTIGAGGGGGGGGGSMGQPGYRDANGFYHIHGDSMIGVVTVYGGNGSNNPSYDKHR